MTNHRTAATTQWTLTTHSVDKPQMRGTIEHTVYAKIRERTAYITYVITENKTDFQIFISGLNFGTHFSLSFCDSLQEAFDKIDSILDCIDSTGLKNEPFSWAEQECIMEQFIAKINP